jgi:hypothetical protein
MELASICRWAHTGLEGTAILSRSRGRDRWFESTFLQRGVGCEPEADIDIFSYGSSGATPTGALVTNRSLVYRQGRQPGEDIPA